MKAAGLIAGIVLAAGAVFPAPAATDVATAAVLPLFQSLCLETQARREETLARAEAAGFVIPPAQMTREMDLSGFSSAEVRAKLVDHAMLMVLVGRGENPEIAGMNMEFCAIGVIPQAANLGRRLEAIAGVQPTTSRDGGEFYVFTDGPAGRRSLGNLSEREMRRRLRDGDVKMMMVMPDGEMTILFFGIVRREV